MAAFQRARSGPREEDYELQRALRVRTGIFYTGPEDKGTPMG